MVATAKTFIISLLAVASLGLADPPAVTLTLSPRMGFEPLTITATYRITPNADNRAVCFVYEGEKTSTSCRDLNGDDERTATTVLIKGLPAGRYVFVVVVERKDRSIVRAVDRACVIAQHDGETCSGDTI